MPPSNNTQSSSNTANKPMSQTKMVQEAGFTSFNQLMVCYGLKMWNPEDVDEGKAILNALVEAKK
jgi:hypothetical protein